MNIYETSLICTHARILRRFSEGGWKKGLLLFNFTAIQQLSFITFCCIRHTVACFIRFLLVKEKIPVVVWMGRGGENWRGGPVNQCSKWLKWLQMNIRFFSGSYLLSHFPRVASKSYRCFRFAWQAPVGAEECHTALS